MIKFRTNPSPWSALILLAVVATVAAAQVGYEEFSVDDPLDYCFVTIIDQVLVPAEEPGVLDELNVREGMTVEKGALLGNIDDTDALLTLAMAKHEYNAAKKQADNTLSIEAADKSQKVAQAEYDTAVEANERLAGTVTATEVRRKLLQAERAMMQIELAEMELMVAVQNAQVKYKQWQRAKAALERRQIVARINGIVVKLNKHVGDWVQAGETVMRIVRMDQLRVEGDINGKLYARHKVIGRPVNIQVQLTGGGIEIMEGTISYASPLVESYEYTVRAVVNNRKINGRWLLTPGLNAKMQLSNTAVSRRTDKTQR
jgi:macrolide-specific efflux system membrane fusion protein